MTASLFVQGLINGLNQGAIYALIALGYTMVYGIIRMINFAHGDIFTVAGFLMVYATASLAHETKLVLRSEEHTSELQSLE